MSKSHRELSAFETYLQELRSVLLKDKTEHTDRPYLQNLFKEIAKHNKNIKILSEPKRAKGGLGSPDFQVMEGESIVGYVEAKNIRENIKALISSKQINKYKQLSSNILLTNYIDFIWMKEEHIQQASLGEVDKLFSSLNSSIEIQNALSVLHLLNNFFSVPPKGIAKAKDLAKALAPRSRILRDFFIKELEHQQAIKKGFLYSLYEGFKERVFKEFRTDEFANVFAQMLAYGLFLARLKSKGDTLLTVDNAKNYIPMSFELMHQLTRFLDELTHPGYEEIKWVVDEIFSIINTFDLEAIHQDLVFSKKLSVAEAEKQVIEKDPYVHFYEDFLKEFDNDLRRQMGVYYTPLPIVHFIIRGVEDILKNIFGIQKGFADNTVTALDFATGTGTFLVEMFRHVLGSLPIDSGKRDLTIQNHLLKNFYGFEYMIAPYAIAHLKVSEFLKEEGYDLKPHERLGIYLTNTLESLDKRGLQLSLPGLDSLDHESEEAQEVKRKPILVIVGNPPYRGESRNKGEFITNLLKDYRFVDGEPLGERNPKWLQDDYVKFIRFAQYKMDQVEEGVVGLITNHGFLDNPTFRGMRASLMKSFNQIYIVNLHGNSKKKEKSPDGSKDENVFDIQQGVCISFFIKKKGLKQGVYYTDWWGKREDKYKLCLNEKIKYLQSLDPTPYFPDYYFIQINNPFIKKYKTFKSIKEIFVLNSVGIVTSKDSDLIDYNWRDLSKKIKQKNNEVAENLIRKIEYRPFDSRFVYYDSKCIARPRENIMRHMLTGDNLGLVSVRQVAEQMYNHAFISDKIIESRITLSNRGIASFIPLYNYQNQTLKFSSDKSELNKIENIAPIFRQWIDIHYQHHYNPEEILGYIYAILYCPTYRAQYLEFLKMDFPRVPFFENRKVFEQLSELGWGLIQAHLMKEFPALGLGQYLGNGSHTIEKVTYNASEQKIYINPHKYFSNIPEEVWSFCIGGYQVLDKYLKSRKKRSLTQEEIENVENVANILAFTIEQMKKIDKVYKYIDPS